MKRCPLLLLAIWGSSIVVTQVGATPLGPVLFRDDFTGSNGSLPNPDDWVINHPESAWWTQGRTFFPSPVLHPGTPLPHIQDDALVIEHHQYNPYHLGSPKTTFLGGEAHTVMTLAPEASYMVEASVRWSVAPPGMVASFFTYGYDSEHSDSDEIDHEFLSNSVFDAPPTVWTNTWNDSAEYPVTVQVPGFVLTQWQTLRIYWYAGDRVDWTWIDPGGIEHVLRTDTQNAHIPDEEMAVYFNLWAASPDWSQAYNGSLQPDQTDQGVVHSYEVDYVEVRLIPIAGDLNADGFTGIEDLNIVLSNWNQQVQPGELTEGDPTGDGFVGIEDLNTVLGNWNAGTPPVAEATGTIPEPATALLLAAFGIAFLRR